jgi:hypothetical protein
MKSWGYIYGRETSPNEKVVELAVAEALEGEIRTAHAELDKHRTFDKEFPLAMRVKGLVDHCKALEALVEGKNGKNKPQRQDAVLDQLRDLIPVANREGCYDAADFLRRTVEDIERKP